MALSSFSCVLVIFEAQITLSCIIIKDKHSHFFEELKANFRTNTLMSHILELPEFISENKKKKEIRWLKKKTCQVRTKDVSFNSTGSIKRKAHVSILICNLKFSHALHLLFLLGNQRKDLLILKVLSNDQPCHFSRTP